LRDVDEAQCAQCNGSGMVECRICTGSGFLTPWPHIYCGQCEGTGAVRCEKCIGEGARLVERSRITEANARRGCS
jgi:DnaJ-class molecular chaperone